jgi:HK97 family phage major capsid protein
MKLGKNNYVNALQQALQSNNEAEIQQAWNDFSASIVDEIRNDYMESVQDKNILVQRGYRQLTTAEQKYYDALITASKCRNVQQAVTTLADLTANEVMPESIIDQVMKDLVEEHPLLTKVNFQNAKYATKIIMNNHSKQNAVWGEIDAEIEKEITSQFKVLHLAQNKLSAFAVIPMGLIDMGPTFLDGYIRTILKDAIACGLEEAIVKGDGDGKPVGLMKKLTGAVDGVHQDKAAQAVTDFGVASMGALIAQMAKNEKGQNRPVGKLSLICNANDYYTLVAPAVRVQNMSGAYVDNFAFPMEVVISEAVPTGKAILADLNNYYVGVGFAKDGVIEFSDEYKFIEDQRTYKIKTYANGRALDENSAIVLDITGLKPAVITVKNN